MRKIGSRLGGLPLQGTLTQIILPVTLAVLGRSSVVLIADVDWGATFGDLIKACGADGFDMLAVRDMVYASSSGEQTGCCSCCDAGAFSGCKGSIQSLRRGQENSKLKLEKQMSDGQIMNE